MLFLLADNLLKRVEYKGWYFSIFLEAFLSQTKKILSELNQLENILFVVMSEGEILF